MHCSIINAMKPISLIIQTSLLKFRPLHDLIVSFLKPLRFHIWWIFTSIIQVSCWIFRAKAWAPFPKFILNLQCKKGGRKGEKWFDTTCKVYPIITYEYMILELISQGTWFHGQAAPWTGNTGISYSHIIAHDSNIRIQNVGEEVCKCGP